MVNWLGVQNRFVDPFSPVNSDNVSSITSAISKGTGRGVCAGFPLSLVDPLHMMFGTGVALKDFITVQFTAVVILPFVDTNAGPGINLVVLRYHYSKTSPPPFATYDVIPPGLYDPTWHLILGQCLVDPTGSFFISVDQTGREMNPGFASTFLELLDTPDSYIGHKGEVVIVDDTETQLIFEDFGILLKKYGYGDYEYVYSIVDELIYNQAGQKVVAYRKQPCCPDFDS